MPSELRELASRVRLLVLDVDGVLTDGRLVYGDSGEQLKVFHVRDGLGIRMVLDAGIEVAVITARRSAALDARLRDLRISKALTGRDDKLKAFEELSTSLGLRADQCVFMGDDILDLPVMGKVGLSIAVADAHPMVRAAARHTTAARGGEGAVREICDALLEAQLGLTRAVQAFLAAREGKEEKA